ncbi:hypothetical protein POSPLADRAFT_1038355 [Postia placenta MAD-698-R-SB12]|uniref:Uncharacterized protein n=1 Tax=Postia placenta MAD-698-R-SB12 TaxID=670580 RepID=A0A1X6NAQ7_9APHY|nr:hypothetical protein POSPLADRAFT_1038355 [Postia placenta MAD-698-R-SB12]OSX65729.1 hypothetical protein POSPLADRAFT_1038355 [Postia placenta MAD-698-R-SB12]
MRTRKQYLRDPSGHGRQAPERRTKRRMAFLHVNDTRLIRGLLVESVVCINTARESRGSCGALSILQHLFLSLRQRHTAKALQHAS